MVETVMERLKTWKVPVCLSDGDAPDHPILTVNDAFSDLTGYSADECVGRNCRFLQTSDTDPETRDSIRLAIEENRRITTCLLNARRDGTLFYNLLFIDHVRLRSGQRLLIGSQFEVSENMAQTVIERRARVLADHLYTGLSNTNVTLKMRRDTMQARAETVQQMVQTYMRSAPYFDNTPRKT